MQQCSDCDSVTLSSDPLQGNGKCSACHGSGFGEFDTAVMEFFDGAESPVCAKCFGSSKCQTCKGTGVIEGPEIKIARLAAHVKTERESQLFPKDCAINAV